MRDERFGRTRPRNTVRLASHWIHIAGIGQDCRRVSLVEGPRQQVNGARMNGLGRPERVTRIEQPRDRRVRMLRAQRAHRRHWRTLAGKIDQTQRELS